MGHVRVSSARAATECSITVAPEVLFCTHGRELAFGLNSRCVEATTMQTGWPRCISWPIPSPGWRGAKKSGCGSVGWSGTRRFSARLESARTRGERAGGALDATDADATTNDLEVPGGSPWVRREVATPRGEQQPVSVVGGCVHARGSTCLYPSLLKHS